jgi:hypothetical protein
VPAQIELKASRPLISGAYRDVFQHPHHADLLIKVIKPLFIERNARRMNWYDVRFEPGHYKGLLREIEKYLLLYSRGQQNLPFIQRFVGIVETDLGLGMVVSRVAGHGGALAPTLSEVVQARGLDADLRARIQDLQEDLIRHHVVFGDISANNIVEAPGATHAHRLVVIDGLNDRLWLPVNAMSRTFYRIYSNRRFTRMIEGLEAIDAARAQAPLASPVVAAGD